MNLVETKDLYVEYETKKGVLASSEIVHAVNGVSLDINEGEILALAGESGCGKSTLAKAILNLEPTVSGQIFYNGEDISEFSKDKFKAFRQNAQIIFQNPYSSLDPKMTIFQTLSEPLEINTKLSKTEIKNIVLEKIEQVGLSEDCLKLYPHEFSGGQRQRIAIARALVLNPKFIVADEPVSALDVSIQAQIITLILELKEKLNLTVLFISHDLHVVKYISDRIGVMYLGEIIEEGKKDEIFENPAHPYTKALLSSVPKV